MSSDENRRYQRPELDRHDPIRNVTGYFRHPERRADFTQTGAGEHYVGGNPMSSFEDVMVQSARLVYRFAEAQLNRGQDIARRLRGASVSSGTGDVGNLVDSGLRMSKELAALGVEFAESIVRAPKVLSSVVTRYRDEQAGMTQEPTEHWNVALHRILSGLEPLLLEQADKIRSPGDSSQGRKPSPTAPPAKAPPLGYSAVVNCPDTLRVDVDLELSRLPQDRLYWPTGVRVTSLEPVGGTEGKSQMICELALPLIGDENAKLYMRVPKDQAPGAYIGEVLDEDGGAVGKLNVRILPLSRPRTSR